MTCYYSRPSIKRAKHGDVGRVLSHDPIRPLLPPIGPGWPDPGKSGPVCGPTWGHLHPPHPVTLTTPNLVAMEKENAGVLPLRPRTRLQSMPQPYVSRVPRVPRAGGPDVCFDGVDDSSRASGAVLLKHRAAWPGTDP